MTTATAPSASHLLARLRFRHLQLIAEIERSGSLTRAAEAIGLTQPAVSKALGELEGMLGFALFTRSAQGLKPTPQGAVVMQGARVLLRELEQLRDEALAAGPDGRVAGLLRLGAPAFLALSRLPPVLARLAAQTPPMAVQLQENTVPRLIDQLLAGELDALVTVYNAEVMREGGRGIRFEPVATETYEVIAPRAHPLQRKRAVAWAALAGERWVLTRQPSLARNFVEDIFRRHGLPPPVPLMETDGPVTAARMVAEGVGLSLTPHSTALEEERSDRVHRLRMQAPLPQATLGLVYRSAGAGHPRLARLREALAAWQGSGVG